MESILKQDTEIYVSKLGVLMKHFLLKYATLFILYQSTDLTSGQFLPLKNFLPLNISKKFVFIITLLKHKFLHSKVLVSFYRIANYNI